MQVSLEGPRDILMLEFIIFGVWTLAVFLAGMAVQYRRQHFLPPIPYVLPEQDENEPAVDLDGSKPAKKDRGL